ncbi:hypothetical protein KIPB_011894, partial [Kipferlia bialata]|eukprot:g11894.t1
MDDGEIRTDDCAHLICVGEDNNQTIQYSTKLGWHKQRKMPFGAMGAAINRVGSYIAVICGYYHGDLVHAYDVEHGNWCALGQRQDTSEPVPRTVPTTQDMDTEMERETEALRQWREEEAEGKGC